MLPLLGSRFVLCKLTALRGFSIAGAGLTVLGD